MGLDMYLHRKTYVKNWDHMGAEELHQISVKLNKQKHPYIDKKKICYIEEEVGYWRKANCIHKWFVDNCQDGVDDCKEYSVSIEEIRELLDICKQINEDHSKASTLLPPQSGFFFGSTSIDDWYFRDIENTIKILEPLVALDDKMAKDREAGIPICDWPYYSYQSSW